LEFLWDLAFWDFVPVSAINVDGELFSLGAQRPSSKMTP
jgi:hypothetical protein